MIDLILIIINWFSKTSYIDIGLYFVLYSPIILAVLFPIAIQYEREGFWYCVLPFTFIALIADLIFRLTYVTVIFLDLPYQYSNFFGRREFTFSDSLERFVLNTGYRGFIGIPIGRILNKIAPKKHIKNLN